jgi:hypothetical protein
MNETNDMKSKRLKIYSDLLIEPQTLIVDWVVGYWNNSTFTSINKSASYRRCKIDIRDYAGCKVHFHAYRWSGFELLDGTIQSEDIDATHYYDLITWDIPSTARYLYLSYNTGQGENPVIVTKENNVQYRLDHLENTVKGREQEYNNIPYNRVALISFLDKYNRKETDNYNQLNIALAGDSIFGIQGDTPKSGETDINTHGVSFTSDMNGGSGLAKNTGHFAPNMYTQNVAYKMLQELQFSHADVKYYNHIASEVTKTGTWETKKAIEDEVFVVETTTQNSTIGLSFGNAKFVKLIFSRYDRPVPTATAIKVEFSTDNGSTWVTPKALDLTESIESDASGNVSLPPSSIRYKFGELIYGGLNKSLTYKIRITSTSTDKLEIWGFETWSNPRLNIIVTAQGSNTAYDQLGSPERFYDDMYRQTLLIMDVPYLNDLGSGTITNAYFKGVATPSTTVVSTPTLDMFYYAGEDGTYDNFGGLQCLKNDCITYDGSTWYIGKGEYLKGKLENYYNKLDALLRRVRTLGIPMFCMITHDSTSFLARPFTIEGKNFMRALVKKYGLPHVDINYIQEKYIDFSSILEPAGTHLNDAGMQLYFEQINKVITKDCNMVGAAYPGLPNLPLRGHSDLNTVNFGYELSQIPIVKIFGNTNIVITSITNSGFATTGEGEFDWEAIVQI